MAATISATSSIELKANVRNTVELAAVSASHELTLDNTLTTANLVWSDSNVIAGGGTNTIDLAGGALVDALGTTIDFDLIYSVAFKNLDAATTMTVVINDVDGSTGDCTIIVRPMGGFLWTAPGGAKGASVIGTITVAGTAADAYSILVVGKTA